MEECLIRYQYFAMTTKFSKEKSSWWTISSIARLYDPSDRLLNSSFWHNWLVDETTNENFDITNKRGHYLMTIQRSDRLKHDDETIKYEIGFRINHEKTKSIYWKKLSLSTICWKVNTYLEKSARRNWILDSPFSIKEKIQFDKENENV